MASVLPGHLVLFRVLIKDKNNSNGIILLTILKSTKNYPINVWEAINKKPHECGACLFR